MRPTRFTLWLKEGASVDPEVLQELRRKNPHLEEGALSFEEEMCSTPTPEGLARIAPELWQRMVTKGLVAVRSEADPTEEEPFGLISLYLGPGDSTKGENPAIYQSYDRHPDDPTPLVAIPADMELRESIHAARLAIESWSFFHRWVERKTQPWPEEVAG